MEEIALKELDSRLHKQIETVRKALNTNPSYSMNVMTNIVQRHPNCLDARKLLREAQQKVHSGKSNPLKSLFSKVSGTLKSIGSTDKIQKDPTAALIAAEKSLNKNPANVGAHKAIAIAAEALDLDETVAFAYADIYRIEPNNTENVKALMSAYIQIDRSDEAIRIGDKAYKANPNDDEIQTLIRKASVEKSIKKGKWEESDDFRTKLKDEEEAHKLEQAAKAKTTDEELRELIKDNEVAVAEQPDNLNLYREIFSTCI